MKKKLLLGLLLGILFLNSELLLADPVYYTYTSEVTFMNNYSGYDYGIEVGDILTHTYLVDTDLDGYWIWLDGTTEILPDYPTYDTYYSTLFSGVILVNPVIPLPAGATQSEFHLGSRFFDGWDAYENMGGNRIQQVSHYYSPSENFGEMRLRYEANYPEDLIGGIVTDFQISTSPPNSSPVPEPATMLLFGSGIVGLAGFRRKFKKS